MKKLKVRVNIMSKPSFTIESTSNQTDVGLWPNIDFVKLDLNSKVPNTAYRKDEVEWIIERFRE
ncbi:myb-like protein X [Vespula maculifrons]|uniref:Myb-like protein X n=1 Tax=Vespula maculifrons TaxID=7453 RepID=A0ABD2AH96_VESMC